MKKDPEAKIDKMLFWPPLALVVMLCAYLVLNPEEGTTVVNKIFSFVTGDLGWTYEIFVFCNIALLLYFIFGKYANKRFGNEPPEFSTLTWLGMLFTSGTSGAILYWGTIEFYYYVSAPPFGVKPFSPDAWNWSLTYSLFHWGISCYGLYVAVGVIFGYFFFVQNKQVFRPSTACEPLIGEKANGLVGKIIDIFYMIGIIGGIGTSVGLGTPLVAELITRIFGIQHTLVLDAVIIVLWTVLFSLSVYTGLEKGIKYLSNIRVYLGYFVLAFIAIAGPASFMMNNFVDSLGIMLNNYLRMSFYTDPHLKSGFPQGWTIFYFAWFMAFALGTGIYLARISRGRTVREFTLGATFAGTLSAYLYFAVLGNYSINLYQQKTIDIAGIINEFGAPRAIVAIWDTLPLHNVLMPIFLILMFISTATLISSVAYTLAMVTSERLRADEEPAKWNRVFWALVLGCLALTLIFLGGLKPLQAVSVAGSFPTMIISVIIFIGFLKKAHWPDPLDRTKKK